MPLWAQVLERLRAGIAAGEYAASFPTDRELMARYDVSRHTVREAVRRLGDEGLLTHVRGRGTTMTARSTSLPDGLALAIEAGGADQARRVIASERGRNRAAARQLVLRPDATMFHLRRLCLAGDVLSRSSTRGCRTPTPHGSWPPISSRSRSTTHWR
jgi:GntR family transcriptional regulator